MTRNLPGYNIKYGSTDYDFLRERDAIQAEEAAAAAAKAAEKAAAAK